MKDPAFLFYTKDFISGTQDMSACEVGAYLRLLMYQHQHQGIPNQPERMMRICGVFCSTEWATIWSNINAKFDLIDGVYVNKRMLNESTIRSSKRPTKIAAATFAGLISTSTDLTKEDIKHLKENFDINSFITDNEEVMKQNIKNWFYGHGRPNGRQYANANANVNVNEIKKGVQGEKTEMPTSPKTENSPTAEQATVPTKTHHTENHNAKGHFISSRTSDIKSIIDPNDPSEKPNFVNMCQRDQKIYNADTWSNLMRLWDKFCSDIDITGERLNRSEALKKFNTYSFNQNAFNRSTSHLSKPQAKKNGSPAAMVYED